MSSNTETEILAYTYNLNGGVTMKKKYIVNGKITYPQGEGALTNFTFTNTETGEMFSLATSDPKEADEITYGDHIVVEVKKDTDPPQENSENQAEQHQ